MLGCFKILSISSRISTLRTFENLAKFLKILLKPMNDRNFLFNQRIQTNFFLKRRQFWATFCGCHVHLWPPQFLRISSEKWNDCSQNWPLRYPIILHTIFFCTPSIFFYVLHRNCHTPKCTPHTRTKHNLHAISRKSAKKILSLYQISKSENKNGFWKQIFGGVCQRTGAKLWV